MSGAPQRRQAENARTMLGLLESVERNGYQSQRHLAAELGIALGLVNAYLKRCVKKGLLKVKQAPARGYAYYITPRGLSEKTRLTFEYLSYSFSFFRAAKTDCAALLAEARARGVKRVALAGVSDLAEIAIICAVESGVEIVAVVDASASLSRFVGYPVARSFDAVSGRIDAVIVTELKTARETYDDAVAHFGRERVLVPSLLSIGQARARGVS